MSAWEAAGAETPPLREVLSPRAGLQTRTCARAPCVGWQRGAAWDQRESPLPSRCPRAVCPGRGWGAVGVGSREGPSSEIHPACITCRLWLFSFSLSKVRANLTRSVLRALTILVSSCGIARGGRRYPLGSLPPEAPRCFPEPQARVPGGGAAGSTWEFDVWLLGTVFSVSRVFNWIWYIFSLFSRFFSESTLPPGAPLISRESQAGRSERLRLRTRWGRGWSVPGKRAAAGRQAASRVSNSVPATANASADLRATGVSAAYLPAHCSGVSFISGSSELRFLVSLNLGSLGEMEPVFVRDLPRLVQQQFERSLGHLAHSSTVLSYVFVCLLFKVHVFLAPQPCLTTESPSLYWVLESLVQFSSVQFSCSVISDSLRPHELQHARPPCPPPSPRVHSNSCPSSRCCHPAILSFLVPFSPHPLQHLLLVPQNLYPNWLCSWWEFRNRFRIYL